MKEAIAKLSKTKFIKSWSASDATGGNALVYTCAIATGANDAVIIANDFSDDYFVNNIAATVDKNCNHIATQQPGNDGYEYGELVHFRQTQSAGLIL